MKISKRTKAIITTAVLFIGLFTYPALWWVYFPFQIGLIYWFLDFDLKPSEIFAFLLPPLLFAYTTYLLAEELLSGFQLPVYLLGAAGYYILLLSLNIMNVSTVRTVPLKRAAYATFYFIGMIAFFMFGISIMIKGWGIGLPVLAYWLVLGGFGAAYLRLLAGSYHWLETVLFLFITGQIIVLINFWPAQLWISVAAMVGWSFIYLGILQHVIDRTLSKSILREYVIFGTFLLIIFLIV